MPRYSYGCDADVFTVLRRPPAEPTPRWGACDVRYGAARAGAGGSGGGP
ncbi:hypothetical protein ACODT3_28735 [Streptomyces sp. 4.24]